MATCHNQILDSPSKDSYIGSYYPPPDTIRPVPRLERFPIHPLLGMDLARSGHAFYQTRQDISSKAVIDALKTLQEKIKRLELDRKQAEKNVKRFSQASHGYENNASFTVGLQTPQSPFAQNNSAKREELASHLQSAQARCQVLEKQLDYMKKMVVNAERDKNALSEQQVALQTQKVPNGSRPEIQHGKLEMLEQECLKLSQTQSLAEEKIAVLEHKLSSEEHERKIVQEKADELQRELNINLRLCPPTCEEVKPRTKNIPRTSRTLRRNDPPSPSYQKGQRVPFVAGTSTSPSHSVHANVQSILHMMKHHQPQLCEQVRALQRSGGSGGTRKNLRRALYASSDPHSKVPGLGPEGDAAPLGSLSDLLLALQDELGQMSFEQKELVQQIDGTTRREDREELERELEGFVKRMEEKASQITKLHKHQQTVHKLTQKTQQDKDRLRRPSPVRDMQPGKRAAVAQNNRRLLREARKFCNSLKEDDISWDT